MENNMAYSDISPFFYPDSICVVGASSKEKSIGYEILRSMKTYGFTGKIFPVNPKSEKVLGYQCFPSITAINEQIDLAIIIVPKKFVEISIDELIQKQVKSIILITAGFRETGKEGEELENRILEKIHKAGIRLIGPNCMGVISCVENIKLNATFVAEKPEKGYTGFLSQSGALGAAVINSLRETDIRFSHFISVGNKADICENDLLRFWNKDDNIQTMTYYLESFTNGFEFLKPFIQGKIKKPNIILKAGRTDSGMKAASSHTGALSSSDKIVNSVLRQFGIIRVDNIHELFNTAKGFEDFPFPKGNRVAVVTNAGGPAILAVDKIEEKGLTLSNLSDTTKIRLREFVNPEGSIENPIDLLPGATAEIFSETAKTVLNDENVDVVVSIFVEPVMVSPLGVVEAINRIESEKPVYQVVMPLPEFWDNYRHNSEFKKPIFRNPEEPAAVISNLLFYKESMERIQKSSDYYSTLLSIAPSDELSGFHDYLSQIEVKRLAQKYNLPLVPEENISIMEFDDTNFKPMFPVVAKGLSEKLIHKSDINAVILDIRTEDELSKAVNTINDLLISNGFDNNRFLIQPFIKTKYELLIGGFRDPSFGPMIMFGTGGKYVEALDDTSMISAYASEKDILTMINSTKIGKIIQGVRNERSIDLQKLMSIIKALSRMMIENPVLYELDINPLTVTPELDLLIVDMRVRVK